MRPFVKLVLGCAAAAALCFAVPAHAAPDLIVWGWGSDAFGALGDGTTSNKSRPVRVTALEQPSGLRTGSAHTLAVGSDGKLYAWGGNAYGQLGIGNRKPKLGAVHVEGLSDVLAIACGADHSLALRANGSVWAWGKNDSGQLGIGAAGDRTSPGRVQGLPKVLSVRGGGSHSLALDASGRVWAWGDNRYGQLGPGGPAGSSDVPVQVTGLDGVAAVEAGERHSLALQADGTLWAWGDNLFGQLGAETQGTTSAEPVRVLGLPPVASVRAGSEFNLALDRDGALWSWGANFDGQLGDGTTVGGREPRRVAGLGPILSFAAGGAHGLAVDEGGTMWAWGSNGYGQVGDGTLEDRPLPVPIADLAASQEVRAGWDRSFAVTEKRLTVASMKKKGDPFRIAITGAHFHEDIKVFIHGWQWPLVTWVNSQKLLLTGRESLKSSVPKDTPTEFRFVNPDGESLAVWWQWP